MTLSVYFSNFTSILSFVGAMFLCIGVLQVSVKKMVYLAQSPYGGWNSVLYIALVHQKIQYQFGFSCIALSFLADIFLKNNSIKTILSIKDVVITTCCIISLLVASYLIMHVRAMAIAKKVVEERRVKSVQKK